LVKCPYCGYEGEHRLLKTWRYRVWDVYYYECPRCGSRFRWQVDPTGRYRSYVMRLGGRLQAKEKQRAEASKETSEA
jgi:DNA-directed RNA polymerase subunit RPC12/RpoP